MARRREVADRRRAMVEEIREASRTGQIRPGEMMPTVREYSEKYGLSAQTVSLQLRALAQEGLLHTVPRVGVFMAPLVSAASDPLLLVSPPTHSTVEVPMQTLRLRIGFEERAAELGLASLSMPLDIAAESLRVGSLPDVGGVFDASLSTGGHWETATQIPWVRYATPLPDEDADEIDRVCFDNQGGGRIATEHLVQQGHAVIAFLGLHRGREHRQDLEYSDHRRAGWAQGMEAAGLKTDGLLYTPPDSVGDHASQVAAASAAAEELVRREDITAVVGANDRAVLGLFDQLRRADVPSQRWPAVVGFDGTLDLRGQMVSSIRLPWEQVGRTAADLLWNRHTGRQTGPAVRHQIPMTLIPRLSSGKSWSSDPRGQMLNSLQR